LDSASRSFAGLLLKIARHTAFNLLGLGLPLLAALAVIPPLVAGLGEARFGVLTLIWAITSYFGLFDLGLGRALTQSLAVCRAKGEVEEVPRLTRTALQLMALLGLLGGLLLALVATWGRDRWAAGALANEWVAGCWWMALALPAITLTAGLRGLLEAVHAFGWINAIRLPMGLLTFAGPWAVLVLHGPDLGVMTAVLAIGRWIGMLVHAAVAWRHVEGVAFRGRWCPEWLPRLLRAGGWLTLSNVVSPLMGYVDRFVIGALVSAVAVAHYATPQEMVTKLWIVPGAVMAVLLPRFAASGMAAWPLMQRSAEVLFWVLLPVCSGLAVFAEWLMGHWIGPAFASHSAPLLQVFALGILINCTAHVPLTWLQGQGAYRAPALLHLAELPLFLTALGGLTVWLGPLGAALAWLLRMLGDTAALFVLAARQAEQPWRAFARFALVGAGLMLLAFAGVLLPAEAVAWRASVWLLGLAAAATIAARRLPAIVRAAD
jgi:O-antigen/teichoic acid export membrane protein